MKTEEVKYVYQSEGPLLMPKTKNGAVYQETTVSNRAKDVKNQQAHCCWPSHLFSRLRLVLSCLAIMACLVVIAVNYLVLSPYFVAVLYNQSILSIRSGISCRHSTRPESFAGVDDQRNQGIKQPRTGTRSGNYHFEGPSRESAEQITSDAKGTPVFSYPPKGFTFQTDYSSRRSIHYVISFVLFIFL
jgi:hypothetical protein